MRGAREREPVAVVGLGRVGSTLALALAATRRVSLIAWDRRAVVRAAARRRLPEATIARTAQEALGCGGTVILAVTDASLSEITPPRSARGVVAHTSGLLSSQALAHFGRRGIATASWHPLCSFARRWGDPRSLAGTAFVSEGSPAATAKLGRLARAIGGVPVCIDARAKPLYHAAAALVANHSMILAGVATRWLEQAGIPRTIAQRSLAALLSSTALHLAGLGPAAGLTGPLARGDIEAVKEHVRAISTFDPESLPLYRITALWALSHESMIPGLDRAKKKTLIDLLGGQPRTTMPGSALRAGSRRDPPRVGLRGYRVRDQGN